MKNLILKSIAALASLGACSTALAGGGGSGWTQCHAKDLGLIYFFSGYTQSLTAGDKIQVSTNSLENQQHATYQITALNLSEKVGIVRLVFLPKASSSASPGTNFGDMKIEYFSDSALKDIKVTFSQDGIEKTSDTHCTTD